MKNKKLISKRFEISYGKKFIKDIVQSIIHFKIGNAAKIPEDIKTIEFVCYGNICRSAFAERYANILMKKEGYSIVCSSSGLFAKEGVNSPKEAVEAALEYNVVLSNHFSKKITLQSVLDADVVICMHYNHFKEVQKRFPSCKSKIYLLKAFNGKINLNINVNDPFGKSTDVFLSCFKEISYCIDNLVKQMKISYPSTKFKLTPV